MADSKITALTAISTVDPAADPLVIVDVSDTSMAASGTTKKSTINQLLGAGGTATLASATITGDLTVDTSTLKVDSANNRVGLLTASPTHTLDVRGIIKSNGTYTAYVNPSFTGAAAIQTESAESLILAPSGQESLRCAPSGVYTFGDGAGGTRMTLNSTGLGVGVSPTYKFQSVGIAAATSSTVNGSGGNLIGALLNSDDANSNLNPGVDLRRWTGTALNHGLTYIATNATGDTLFYNGTAASNTRATSLKMTLDASGNLILLSSNTPATLTTNGQLTVNATSNTNLRFSYRGSDGVTRVANITLA